MFSIIVIAHYTRLSELSESNKLLLSYIFSSSIYTLAELSASSLFGLQGCDTPAALGG